ncbi:membrane protein [Corynebacterium flavescens]|uniref:Membrane protein n=2 Tax=Corynebacterium flavescens TaxID=28028 RepID=A0AB73B9E9_CORFL|nr:membrane protein [Corynebacterium flavescens]
MSSLPPAGMHPVSPKLVTARYIVHLGWTTLLVIVAAVVGYLWTPWAYWGLAVCAVWACYLLWLIPAQVGTMAWLEDEDELLITRGKLWHTFTVVPYGRIQFVDVSAGPIERWLGIRQLQLHTASAGTDATIKGLPAATADALRERLADKARERMSGL